MKNILNPTDSRLIVHRIGQISPTSIAEWGTMSAAEMLFHCSAVNLSILGAKPSTSKPKFKQRIYRIVILGIFGKLPKGIQANPKFIAHDQSLIFETERKKLIDTITPFSDPQLNMEASHPIFGKMNHKDWGRFVWIHHDHHLRQFGV